MNYNDHRDPKIPILLAILGGLTFGVWMTLIVAKLV